MRNPHHGPSFEEVFEELGQLQEIDALAAEAKGSPGTVEAVPFLRNLIGEDLRKMREAAGLTVQRAASRVGKSAAFVRECEAGRTPIGSRLFDTFARAYARRG
jgi:hypothetical protein